MPVNGNDLYDKILQVATLPALAFCVVLSIVIIRIMMSPKWMQARRNKQIRKAQAQRKRDEEQRLRDEAEDNQE